MKNLAEGEVFVAEMVKELDRFEVVAEDDCEIGFLPVKVKFLRFSNIREKIMSEKLLIFFLGLFVEIYKQRKMC